MTGTDTENDASAGLNNGDNPAGCQFKPVRTGESCKTNPVFVAGQLIVTVPLMALPVSFTRWMARRGRLVCGCVIANAERILTTV